MKRLQSISEWLSLSSKPSLKSTSSYFLMTAAYFSVWRDGFSTCCHLYTFIVLEKPLTILTLLVG